jgi:hypothetical protein
LNSSHFVQLIAIGLQAQFPAMTGFPGVGRPSSPESRGGVHARGRQVQVVILVGSIRSHRISAASGLDPDGVRLLPMAWARDAKRLAEDGYLVIVLLDG